MPTLGLMLGLDVKFAGSLSALFGDRLLEVVAVGGRIKRAVARIGDHDPFATEHRAQLASNAFSRSASLPR